MISFERWKDGFLLTVEGKRVLRHASASPAIFAGTPKAGARDLRSRGSRAPAGGQKAGESYGLEGEVGPLAWKSVGACEVISEGPACCALRFGSGLSLRIEYASPILRMSISSAPGPGLDSAPLAGAEVSGPPAGIRLIFDADPREKLFGLGPCPQAAAHHDVKKTRVTLESAKLVASTVFADSGSWIRAHFDGRLSWRFDAGKTVLESQGHCPDLAMGFSVTPLEGFASLADCCGRPAPCIEEKAAGLPVRELLRRLLSLSFSGVGVIGIPAYGARAMWTAFGPLFVMENGGGGSVGEKPAAIGRRLAQADQCPPGSGKHLAGADRLAIIDGCSSPAELEGVARACPDRLSRRAATIFAGLRPYHEFCRQRWQVLGLPETVQPAVYYPGDRRLWERDDEFLYGPDLLVAPQEDGRGGPRELVLPDDTWVHFWTSRVFPGGAVVVDAHPDRPAVFYRRDSDFARLFDTLRQLATRL